MRWVVGICLIGFLSGCRDGGKEAGTLLVDTAVLPASIVEPDTSVANPVSPAISDSQADEFLRRLEKAMLPVRDSLERESRKIASIPRVEARDSAVVDLDMRWNAIFDDELDAFLLDPVFLSRMWIDSLKGPDTTFERQVRSLLESGGKAWDYEEGFDVVSDIASRMDLFGEMVSPALGERLSLMHLETRTELYNDAGFVAPLDTFAGRILGWEAFARKFPGTTHAALADSTRSRYLYNVMCGSPNTRPFDKGQPDSEFFGAWKRLAADSLGPSGKFVREWLKVLESEKRKFTPRAKSWLVQRGYAPEEFE